MDSNNKSLFDCLCRDLGYSLLRKTNEKELDSLKKELLQLSESEFDPIAKKAYSDRFSSIFRASRPEDIEDVTVFRDHYQLMSFQLKIRQEHTDEQQTSYIARLKANEAQTRAWRVDRRNPITRLARYITRMALRTGSLTPEAIQEFARHGPGAVLDGTRYDDKSWWSKWYRTLNVVFPEDWLFASPTMSQDCLRDRNWLCDDKIECKLALVPKDWKGPRGVFISPKEAVFCQLGIDGALKDLMSRSFLRLCYDPTKQDPSREVSHIGSYNRSWSTLDLSDASDLIPVSLIAYLLHRKDYLPIACTRPVACLLPSGEKIARFAMSSPMGDGKTFAVLTLVCACITMAAISHSLGYTAARPPLLKDLWRIASMVRVFGDDIAVHTRFTEQVISALEIHNLKVNVAKSFYKGFFREACGYDAFKGAEVTPLRQKVNLDYLRAEDMDRLIAFHNRAVHRYSHCKRTIALLEDIIIRRYGVMSYTSNSERSPMSLLTSPSNVIYRNLRGNIPMRVSTLHRLEAYGYTGKNCLTYSSPIDERYRLNYALFPKNRKHSSEFFSEHWEGIGSPLFQKVVDDGLRRHGSRIRKGPRRMFLRGWVEIV